MKLTIKDRIKIFLYNLNSPNGKIRPEVINLYLRLKNKPEEFSVFSEYRLFDVKTKILYSPLFINNGKYVYCQTFSGGIEEKIKTGSIRVFKHWSNLFNFNYAESSILNDAIIKLIENHYAISRICLRLTITQ